MLRVDLGSFGHTIYSRDIFTREGAIGLGIAGLAAASLYGVIALGSYLQRRTLDLTDHKYGTAIPLNAEEMKRLTSTQQYYQERIAQLNGKLEPVEKEFKSKHQELSWTDSFCYLLPSFVGTPLANAAGANLVLAQEVDRLKQNVRGKKDQIQFVTKQAQTIDRQHALMVKIGKLEGALVALKERTQTAQKALSTYTKDLGGGWKALNKRQKVIYWIPTQALRAVSGAVLGVERAPVEECVTYNGHVQQTRNKLNKDINDTSTAYRNILESMYENMTLEQRDIHGRFSHLDVFSAYGLACQLKSKAQETLGAISTYRWRDNCATSAEMNVGPLFGGRPRSAEEERRIREHARNERFWATQALNRVTYCLESMQSLGNQLHQATKKVRNQVGWLDTLGIRPNNLTDAAASMQRFNFSEIFFGVNAIPIFNLFHNFQEWQNNERVVKQVQEIQESASELRTKLQEPAIRIFEQERALLRNQKKMPDADLFRFYAQQYLQSW